MTDVLSSHGEERRETILRLAQDAARQRRRRRLALRVSAGCASLVLLLLISHRAFKQRETIAPRGSGEIVMHMAPALEPEPSALVIGEIKTDPTIVQRWTVPASPPQWQTIGDDDLLRTLADDGEPAGLIQVAGVATLVTSTPTSQ